MKTYLVERNCWGYKGRYWTKGEIVKIEEKEKSLPPRHFKLIDEEQEKKIKESNLPQKEKPISVSELGNRVPDKAVTASSFYK